MIMKMKTVAFILYTIFCLALGSLLFKGEPPASAQSSAQYYRVVETNLPPGSEHTYYGCFMIVFSQPVTKSKVLFDWKSNQNLAIWMEK